MLGPAGKSCCRNVSALKNNLRERLALPTAELESIRNLKRVRLLPYQRPRFDVLTKNNRDLQR
jgi:hypothetical protein